MLGVFGIGNSILGFMFNFPRYKRNNCEQMASLKKMEYTIALCELLFQIHYPLGGLDSKESAGSAGDPGPILGSGRFPGEGNGYPLQYSCLENPMDRGAWQAIVSGFSKSRIRLNN